jgi:hypothetical protein
MDRKMLLACLGLGALVFVLGGCSDSGDPHFPTGQSANATITVMDHVGDWDNLVVQGEMTDADGVAMVQDGLMWTASLTGLQPGTYTYSIFTNDGLKALVEVASGFTLEVGDDYQVSGDEEVMVEPSAGTGFNLVVENFDPAYVNIEIKGSMNDWTPAITGHSDDHVYWYLHFAADVVAEGNYEWGVIENDGSEWGIWLLPGGNLTFTVDGEGVPSGTLTFVIDAPAPITQLTLNCDLNAYVGEITTVGASGTFNGWANPPSTLLTDENADGIYTVTIEVEQNQSGEAPARFKFLVNGAWEVVPAACGVDDGYGAYNRTVEIFTAPVTYSTSWLGCPE